MVSYLSRTASGMCGVTMIVQYLYSVVREVNVRMRDRAFSLVNSDDREWKIIQLLFVGRIWTSVYEQKFESK